MAIENLLVEYATTNLCLQETEEMVYLRQNFSVNIGDQEFTDLVLRYTALVREINTDTECTNEMRHIGLFLIKASMFYARGHISGCLQLLEYAEMYAIEMDYQNILEKVNSFKAEII